MQAVANRIVSPRAPWRAVLGGIAGALVFVCALNQARIVVLYLAVLNVGKWFTPLHSVVFPSLFVLLALAYFTWWARPRGVRGPTSHAA